MKTGVEAGMAPSAPPDSPDLEGRRGGGVEGRMGKGRESPGSGR